MDRTLFKEAPSAANGTSQYLLYEAQQFSQLSIQHIHTVRQHVTLTNTPQSQALHELVSAYEKLSALKWESARKAYESEYNESLEDDVDELLRDSMPKCNSKTPGRKRENVNTTVQMNPHDWIANALNDFGLRVSTPVASREVGLTPPGFSSDTAGHLQVEQSCESVCTSGKETAKCTSIPSEISSLGNEDASCEERDEPSIELAESDVDETEFDYIYKGGFAMKVINGREVKGVVPKTVKHVLVDCTIDVIDEGAFMGCNSLESITIPSTVQEVRDNAFRKCAKLKSVKFLTRKCSNKSIEQKKMDHSRGRRSTSTSNSSVRSSQLRSIGEWAFFNCSSLVSINLPNGLEIIGTRAFQRCSALNLPELPSSLMIVEENAFSGCSREIKSVLERWERDRV